MTPPNLSLFMIMVCFWVSFFLIDKFLLKPVGAVLEERHRRIDGAQKEWASKNEEYLSATSRLESEMEEAAREAGRIRAEFRERAQEKRQNAIDGARGDAGARLDGALAELDQDASKARQELRTQAEQLARVFAGQLLQREVRS